MNVVKNLRLVLISIMLILFTASISSAASSRPTRTPRNSYDIIIAGAGTGGISAAIQAARMGASVLVVEPGTWIGGQATAAGVSTMDDMSRQKSGLYLELFNMIKGYYDRRGKSMGTCYWNSKASIAFEPHIGQEAFVNLINDARKKGTLEFLMNSEIIRVQKEGNRVTGVTVGTPENERSYLCEVLIDATEYGEYTSLHVEVNGVEKAVDDAYYYSMHPVYIHANDHDILLVDTKTDNDYRILYTFDLEPDGAIYFGNENAAFDPDIPSRFGDEYSGFWRTIPALVKRL